MISFWHKKFQVNVWVGDQKTLHLLHLKKVFLCFLSWLASTVYWINKCFIGRVFCGTISEALGAPRKTTITSIKKRIRSNLAEHSRFWMIYHFRELNRQKWFYFENFTKWTIAHKLSIQDQIRRFIPFFGALKLINYFSNRPIGRN